MHRVRKWLVTIPMLMLLMTAWGTSYRMVMHIGYGEYAISIDSIDSVIFGERKKICAHLKDSSMVEFCSVESISFRKIVPDTLFVMYDGNHAAIKNPRADAACVCLNDSNADVLLKISEKYKNPIISVCGQTPNGRLCIDSETDYTLVLNEVNIASSHAPAINSISKQKATVVLEKDTKNCLSDAYQYVIKDSTESSNGCFNTQGALSIVGNGQLTVCGNMKHAVYAKKSITIKEGNIHIKKAKSDAIHSGKNVTIEGGEIHLTGMNGDGIDLDDDFTLKGGSIKMKIEGETAKGIKCGKMMTIEGGAVKAIASGALKNKNGDLAYCTILKCDSCMTVTGGDFHLVNRSLGGKCISVDYNLEISGGLFYMETSGDGAEYVNVEGGKDYFTSKCLAADDTLRILRGNLLCISTGIGGKGIVGGKFMEIGKITDTTVKQGPNIVVETTNSSIVNDVEEDARYGCPKAMKASQNLNIYSGTIKATTKGMGGEGVECGKDMFFYGGILECNCFDDGINVGEKLEVLDGQIYCFSEDNDGIDSNGSIYIKGGLVASVNKSEPNESFDSEGRQFYVSGGTVIGIGSSSVKMDQEEQLYYNTLYNIDPSKPARRGLRLTNGKYLYVMDGNRLILALKNDNAARRGFVTVSLPEFIKNQEYSLFQGEKPEQPSHSLFNEKLFIGGMPQGKEFVIDIQPKYNYND